MLPLWGTSTPRPQAPSRQKVDGWVKGLLNRTFGSYALATFEGLFFPWVFAPVSSQLSPTLLPLDEYTHHKLGLWFKVYVKLVIDLASM